MSCDEYKFETIDRSCYFTYVTEEQGNIVKVTMKIYSIYYNILLAAELL